MGNRKDNVNGLEGEPQRFKMAEKHFQSITQVEALALHTLKEVVGLVIPQGGRSVSLPPCSVLPVDVYLSEDPCFMEIKDLAVIKDLHVPLSSYVVWGQRDTCISIMHNASQLFPLVIALPSILFDFFWEHPRQPSFLG